MEQCKRIWTWNYFCTGIAKESRSARHGCLFDKPVATESINSVSCWVWLTHNDLFCSVLQNRLKYPQIYDHSSPDYQKPESLGFQWQANAVPQIKAIKWRVLCGLGVLAAPAGSLFITVGVFKMCPAVWGRDSVYNQRKWWWSAQVTISFSQDINWWPQLRLAAGFISRHRYVHRSVSASPGNGTRGCVSAAAG